MELFVYTVLYAFVGWLIEVSFYVYKTKSFVNRGFLHGPFVPIYGLSLVSLHLLLSFLFASFTPVSWGILFSVFLLIIVIGTLLELIGGIVLFNLFETRWWDYSAEPLNYKGYICLPFSLIWGVLGTGGFFLIHVPFVIPFVEGLSQRTLVFFTVSMGGILLIDLVFTVHSLWNFRKLISEFSNYATRLQQTTQKLRYRLPKPFSQALDMIKHNDRLNAIYQRFDRAKDTLTEIKDKALINHYSRLDKTLKMIHSNRLYKAFPNLKVFKRKKEHHDE